MGQGKYRRRLHCGFCSLLGVDAAPTWEEQQRLPGWETKPGSRSKSWAEQKLWHSPSGMVEVLPGCVVVLFLLLPQQGGLQKPLLSVWTCHYSTHHFHPKPTGNWAYLPQICRQLLFQICRGHHTSGIKNPLFNTFIVTDGKPSIACSKYSLHVALSSGLFSGGRSWLHLNVVWPLMG